MALALDAHGVGAAGPDLAPEAVAADHERVGEDRVGRLGLAVAEHQARLELLEPAQALAGDGAVGQAELVQPAHARRALGDEGGLLEVQALLVQADAGERVGGRGLVAELGVEDAQAAAAAGLEGAAGGPGGPACGSGGARRRWRRRTCCGEGLVGRWSRLYGWWPSASTGIGLKFLQRPRRIGRQRESRQAISRRNSSGRIGRVAPRPERPLAASSPTSAVEVGSSALIRG